jgi:hypothetical protein
VEVLVAAASLTALATVLLYPLGEIAPAVSLGVCIQCGRSGQELAAETLDAECR